MYVNEDSLQVLFDKVATHLIKQGKPSMNGGVCKYRSEDDLKCAVGCLIPDEYYKFEMEEHSIRQLDLDFGISFKNCSHKYDDNEGMDMLSKLQSLHDEIGLREKPYLPSIKIGLIEIARTCNLSTESVDHLLSMIDE